MIILKVAVAAFNNLEMLLSVVVAVVVVVVDVCSSVVCGSCESRTQ